MSTIVLHRVRQTRPGARSPRSEFDDADASRILLSAQQTRFIPTSAAAIGIAAFGGVNLLAGAQQGAGAGHSEQAAARRVLEHRLAGQLVCARERAAEYWGRLFNVDVTWFDPELSATKQLAFVKRSHRKVGLRRHSGGGHQHDHRARRQDDFGRYPRD